ncbi:MAG: amino acid ABC transporter permease [Bacillota bacterium]
MEVAEYLNIAKQLAEGMSSTLTIFVSTLIFSMPLGLVIAFGRMSKFAPLQWLMRIYISIVRGTPLMLQLLVVYFAPYYLFGIRLTTGYRLTAVLIGFAFNYAAYFAEIYRAGIESIPVGQYEAATVLGYNRVQIFIRIVFPQMVKRILPPVTNEVITLVKDTAMAYALSYAEMFTLAKQISAAKTSIAPLFMAGVFYFVFNAIVAYVMERAEKSMSYYR